MKAIADLRKKSDADLDKEMVEARLDLVKLSAQLSTGGASKEVGKARNLKRKIARIKTLHNERRKTKE